MKEELRRFLNESKEKVNEFINKVQDTLINRKEGTKNKEQILLNQQDNENRLNDLLFLIRYSLKYKHLCLWPSHKDVFTINYKLNESIGETDRDKERSDEANATAHSQTNQMEKKNNSDQKLNTFFNDDVSFANKIKMQWFMYFILNNYRVKILVEALSAMNRPINIVYINCPDNKCKKGIFQKVYDMCTPTLRNKIKDTVIGKTNECEKHKTYTNVEYTKSNYQTKSLDTYNYDSFEKREKENYVAGYNPLNNTIWICANTVKSPYKLKYVLTHELIHAFDFARANINMNNCYHVACSEIRAYHMSQQCSYFNSTYFGVTQKKNCQLKDIFNNKKNELISETEKNKCIYNNTFYSLYQYAPCRQNAEHYINAVFEKCVNDYWPFMSSPEKDSKYKPSKIFRKDIQ